MAPKKASPSQQKVNHQADSKLKAEDTTEPSSADKSQEKTKTTSKKRKPDVDEHQEPKKAQRRSGRGSIRATPEKLLSFLLSKESEELTRPDEETEEIKKRGGIKTYSSTVMNPFEELMCAIILSRPISHRLGLRTIRTVLNDPYNFSSAKAVQSAGSQKQHQALWDARTQHKDKTASQLGLLADVVLDKFSSKNDPEGKELSTVLQADIDSVRDTLKSNIKGLGATGLDIFSRRVQWLWDDVFPYIDGRTVDSLRKFSLPYSPDQLERLINDNWKKLDTKHLAGSSDEQKKRRAFVVVLERVVGADLEGKVETVLQHASK